MNDGLWERRRIDDQRRKRRKEQETGRSGGQVERMMGCRREGLMIKGENEGWSKRQIEGVDGWREGWIVGENKDR
mgnify:CR=1 FL=1